MNNLSDQLELLPAYLSGHLLLSLGALSAGALLCIPLTLAALRFARLQGTLLAVASVVQTVPSIALLALMVPLLGRIGFLPAWLALMAYSVLPMLRNAITGITGVDPAVVEAARGVGMTERQALRMVQLPLAAPVIVAGVRTSTVWVVGIATLATPVGATSLGNYIFSGLQTQRFDVVLLGCLASAALALVLDGLIRLLEIASARRSAGLALATSAALAALFIAGLTPGALEKLRGGDRTRIVIGAKTFTEQHILAEMAASRLRDAGYNAQTLPSLGSTIVFDALINNRVDCYVDYTGTIWANHMKRSDMLPAEDVRREVGEWMKSEHGAESLGALGFENTYTLAMRRDAAEALGITTIRELALHAPEMRIGGDYEFFARPEWDELRETYNLSFREQRSFDSTLMYQAVQTGDVEIIAAFSTDGRIAAFDLITLEDTVGVFPPYEAVMLLAPRVRDDEGVREALQPLIGAIDDAAMRHANMLVDVEKQSIRDAAAWLRGQAETRD